MAQFVPEGSIDKNSSLFQAIASNWKGNKPLLEPMITKIHDLLWPPYASAS